MIIPHHDKSRKRKKKNLTKKLSILNAYINFKLSKVSNSREVMKNLLGDEHYERFNKMLKNARKKANYYVSKDPEGMTKMDLYDFYIIGDVYREEFRNE